MDAPRRAPPEAAGSAPPARRLQRDSGLAPGVTWPPPPSTSPRLGGERFGGAGRTLRPLLRRGPAAAPDSAHGPGRPCRDSARGALGPGGAAAVSPGSALSSALDKSLGQAPSDTLQSATKVPGTANTRRGRWAVGWGS